MDGDDIYTLARDVTNYVKYMGSLGVDRLPVGAAPEPVPIPEPSEIPSAPAKPAGDESLDDIQADLGDCTRCPLCERRNSIVFGEGPADARIMFIGEGPGADEDRQGRPFVGAAGKLLTDIIVKGMKLHREECYIANVVKCRPPGNRDPKPEEAETCLPFLHRQIQAIQPAVIVALGRVAAHYLLNTNAPLAALRHRFHDLKGIPVMPTYHPAALLRNPGLKRGTWEDIKLVMAKLDLPG